MTADLPSSGQDTTPSHTPGPWRQDGLLVLVPAGDGQEIVAGCWGHSEERVPEGVANARLIAAAPDLLAALKPMLEEFGARLSDGKPLGYTVASMNRSLEMVKTAEAAIAKAKGGAS